MEAHWLKDSVQEDDWTRIMMSVLTESGSGQTSSWTQWLQRWVLTELPYWTCTYAADGWYCNCTVSVFLL